MQDIQVRRAKRQKLRAAIAIIGASGSGKTLGALLIAYGMMKTKYPDLEDYDIWGKIGLIDTEHDRSLVYEGMVFQDVQIGEFLQVSLSAPYSIQRFSHAFKLLIDAGAEVIIADSASHLWEGEGGVLDYQQHLGGRFQDWQKANKDAYNPLVRLITGEAHDVHVINTIRAKQEYVVDRNEFDGKIEVKKLGLKPVQRDSLEYEFQVVFNVDMEHKFRTSKDNSTLFEGRYEPITPEIGKQLYEWLEAGVDIFAERRAEEERREQQRKGLIEEILRLVNEFEIMDWFVGVLKHPYFNVTVETITQLNLEQLEKLRVGLQGKIEEIEKQKTGGNE